MAPKPWLRSMEWTLSVMFKFLAWIGGKTVGILRDLRIRWQTGSAWAPTIREDTLTCNVGKYETKPRYACPTFLQVKPHEDQTDAGIVRHQMYCRRRRG